MKRDVALLEMQPLLKQRALVWEGYMKKKGLGFVYTSVARFYDVQIALYAQGVGWAQGTGLGWVYVDRLATPCLSYGSTGRSY